MSIVKLSHYCLYTLLIFNYVSYPYLVGDSWLVDLDRGILQTLFSFTSGSECFERIRVRVFWADPNPCVLIDKESVSEKGLTNWLFMVIKITRANFIVSDSDQGYLRGSDLDPVIRQKSFPSSFFFKEGRIRIYDYLNQIRNPALKVSA